VTVQGFPDTKSVGVTFPNAFQPAVNPTVINLNPQYAPVSGWGNFSASDIKFEIKDNRGNDFTNLGSIDLVRDESLYGMWPWPPPLFTQTFYDNDGNKLGEYSFFAGDRWGDAGYFDRIHEDTNNDGIFNAGDQAILSLPPPNALPMVLELSKTVTELPE
jgi:hypothetical protein